MNIGAIDDLAERAAANNRSYLLALQGALSQHLDTSKTATGLDRAAFHSVSGRLHEDYLNTASHALREGSVNLMRRAFANATRSLAKHADLRLIDHVEEATDIAISNLVSQARRDRQMASTTLRNIALQAQMIVSARGWTHSASIVALREQGQTQLQFKFVDRSGKRWDSSRYVYSLARAHYLTVYNEVYLFALASQGKTEAFVRHERADHPHHNMRFSLLPGDDKIPHYAEIVDEVFHPNSHALVVDSP